MPDTDKEEEERLRKENQQLRDELERTKILLSDARLLIKSQKGLIEGQRFELQLRHEESTLQEKGSRHARSRTNYASRPWQERNADGTLRLMNLGEYPPLVPRKQD